MKYVISLIIALCMSTLAAAQTNLYNANVPGGVIHDPRTGMSAASKMTFGCDDPVYGQYDLCVDVYFHNIPQGQPNIFMKSNVNKKFTSNNKNILIRYIFTNEMRSGVSYTRSIRLHDLEAQQSFNVSVEPLKKTYMVKSSTDGGNTWTVANQDVR